MSSVVRHAFAIFGAQSHGAARPQLQIEYRMGTPVAFSAADMFA